MDSKAQNPLVTLATAIPLFKGHCVVCQRDDSKRHPISKKRRFARSSTFRGLCPACRRDFEPLVKMKHEDAPERLIEVIQDHMQTRETREAAMVELLSRFKYLIRKQVNDVYNRFHLGEMYNYPLADFYHDGLAVFIDLVQNDFEIRRDPEVVGLAFFANYIQVKFYRNLQHLTKKIVKAGVEDSFDYAVIGTSTYYNPTPENLYENNKNQSGMRVDIEEAMIANTFQLEDFVIENISNERCSQIVAEVFKISHELVAKNRIDERNRNIWEAYFNSGLRAEEIGKYFSSKDETSQTIGKARVLQIARTVNKEILAEFARRNAVRFAGIDTFIRK